MPALSIRTPEGLTLRAELAGAGSRYGAAMVDGALFVAAYLFVVLAVLVVAQVDPSGLGQFVIGLLGTGLILLFVVYQAAFLAAWGGQTPGKRVFGLRVASHDGYPAGALALCLRSLLWPIDVLVPFLGVVVITLTERRQRLGDLAAGTVVLRERTEEATEEPFAGETWSGLAERTLPLMPGFAAQLSTEDVAFLRELWTRDTLDSAARRRIFIAAARHYCERLGVADFADARVVLRELYLFAREMRGR